MFCRVNTRKIRDSLRLMVALLFAPLYFPHLLLYVMGGANFTISQDVKVNGTDSLKLGSFLGLLYLLHNDRYFRSLFYHRIGPVWKLIIGWWRPGDKYFIISATTRIGAGMRIAHPYSTIINAESIGDNFSCIQGTTLGAKNSGRPIIGNNVQLGANVIIIGNVKIGNNVIIGAGSVVVKDISDNSVAVGNPAKVIKLLDDV